MWDGRRDALYNQVFGVIESPVEMNSSRLYAAERVFASHRSEYEALFGALPALDDNSRFPQLDALSTGCSQLDEASRVCSGAEHGIPGDKAEFDQLAVADQDAVNQVVVDVGKAIGAYERLLSCGASRFDHWIQGDDPSALSASEQRGAALFVGKGRCATCHSGPFMSDERFHDVGLKAAVVATVFTDDNDPGAGVGLASMLADPLAVNGKFSDGDDGRDHLSIGAAMIGAFRTPKLRCVSLRPSFMHTAQLLALSDVISFFDNGGDDGGFLGTNELTPIGLTTDERADLLAFLGTLNGPGPDAALLAPPP
jgi:cytochrome c peroxidase